jgi:hypothetical protein
MTIDWVAVSALAATASALFAAIAAYLSFRAAQIARVIAVEGRANDFVKKYLELAVQLPELSTEGSKEEQEQQRYEWFVNFTLMMAREVLNAYPEDPNWRRMMFEQLRFNRKELQTWKKDDFVALGTKVVRLVEDVLAEKTEA